MKGLTKIAFAAACALTLTASAASAEIVCNEEGDCWRVKERYEYRPEFNLQIYPNDWRWEERENKRYRWREHDGRGYWRKGVWIEF